MINRTLSFAAVLVGWTFLTIVQILGVTTIVPMGAIGRPAAGGGASPGTTNLLAWYDFADAVDAHAAYDLTEANSPGYTGGSPTYGTSGNGTAAHWTQSALDDDFGDVDGDWCIVMRFRPLTGIASADSAFTGNTTRTKIEINTTALGIRGNVGTTNLTDSAVVPAIDGTVWYLVVLCRSTSANESRISVNGATYVTESTADNHTTGTFFFGANSGTDAEPCDIDYAAFYSRTLTQDEVTWLYNSGGTRTYSDL